MRKLLLSIGLIICSALLFGQTATLRVGSVDVSGFEPGDKVYIPVYVDEITPDPGDIFTLQMFIAFDHSVLSWDGTFGNPLTGVQNFHPNFPYGTTAGSWMFNDNGTEMACLWDDPVTPHYMPAGGMFFEYIFTYLGGTTNLTWGIAKATDSKGATEMYDGNFAGYTLNLIDGYVGFANYDITFHVTENGSNLEGADVTVGAQTITTDVNGNAVFSLPDGNYSYLVTKAGYTNKTGNFTVAGANATIQVPMFPVGSEFDVTFVVTSGGNPVEGASVDVGGQIILTNALGEAVFSLPNGDYSYTVSKYGYTPAGGVFTVTSAAQTIPVDLVMLPHYDVIFHVTAGGNNLDGALVDIEDVEAITTDINGEALFSLIDGTYNYTVSKSGYTTETGSITVSGSGFTQEVLLDVLYDITFHITYDGNPVQNAAITIGSVTKYTNASGTAVFQLMDGNYDYTVTKSGFEPIPGNFTVAGANQTIDLVLVPEAYEITFHVTDLATGLDIENAVVTIGAQQISTDVNGIAVFFLIDGEYYYTVNKPGYFEESNLFNVSGGPMNIEVEMTLIPLYPVTIHVTSGGAPLAGVAVTIETNTVTTNANGDAVFNLPAGVYNYSCVLLGYQTQTGSFLLTGPDPMTINVNMPPTLYDITFHVTSGGNPVIAAAITINPGNITGATNGSGTAVFSLQNGAYTYTVVKDGYITETGSFTVNNNTFTVEVEMDPQPWDVTFHIVSTGGPLEGVTVVCGGQTQITNASGNAVFSFPDGTYAYTCTKPDYLPLSGDVTVAGGPVTKNLIMYPDSWFITFVIKDQGNQPLLGAVVTINGQSQTTPANGTVVFDLANGTYPYTVVKDGYQTYSAQVVVNNAAQTINVNMTIIGIEDIASGSFNVYPNPANGIFNLTTSAIMGYESDVTIYDLSGKLVYSGKLEGSEVNVIDLSAQEKGTYIMQIIVDHKIYNKTLVIQ